MLGQETTSWAMVLTSHTLRTVALGAAVLGAVSGVLGSFAVLRRQSLIGDTVSHAALPGIALAFLLTGTRSHLLLLLGAAIAGLLSTMFVVLLLNTSKLKEDTALGIVLSVFFGTGLMLLTFVQRLPNANQAGLDRYLFGQAAALLYEDIWIMVWCGVVALVPLLAFWKEFKIITFDRQFAASIGLPVQRFDMLMTTLLVVAIVMGLQMVGVVLMSAMIVAPGAAARQWTNRLGRMVVLSALFGSVSGALGAFLSSLAPRLPAGPIIVLCATSFALLSLLFAPAHGVIWSWVRQWIARRRFAAETALVNLYELATQHGDWAHPHSIGAIRAMSPTAVGLRGSLRRLVAQGLVVATSDGKWALTKEGQAEAERIIRSLGQRESVQ